MDPRPGSYHSGLLDERPELPAEAAAELLAWCEAQPEIEAAYLSRHREWRDREQPNDVTTLDLRLVGGVDPRDREREVRLTHEGIALLERAGLDVRRVTFLADAGWPPVRERGLTVYER